MKIRNNVFIVVFTAILFIIIGSWNIFAQNEPKDKNTNNKGKQTVQRLILKNDSTNTNAIVTVEDKKGQNHSFNVTQNKGEVSASIPNGFGENGDIFRLKIKDSQGECDEQVRFDWNKSEFKDKLHCPNLKTRIGYTMTRKIDDKESTIKIKFYNWEKDKAKDKDKNKDEDND